MPPEGHKTRSHRYGCGAVLWHRGDARYYHIADRYVSLESDQLLYRVWDSTHTTDELYTEDDLEETFVPAGIRIDVKPAEVFGGRMHGQLVGYRKLWAHRSSSGTGGVSHA